ncbi:MAG: carbohydrate ABC transporter substrate-binding protein [Chloroflexi bacterium]|nr:carbohydrate ABC transporter substrate-binding protein [Chloroflexota bacterium]
MSENMLSRRDFLRLSAMTAAGAAFAACAGPAPAPEQPAVKPAATEAPAAAPPAAKEVTLDVMSLAEYEGPYREIWNVFDASHPGIKINVFSINEDTAAAHEAKVAGGYLPAIELTQEMQIFFDKNNYQMAVNLDELDFPWWDRWQFDVKNMWSDLHGLPGPRSLDVFQGFVMTWQYNKELMDQAGLDPQRDVKTWEDLKKWLAEGAAWAAKTDGVDWFWNQAWHNWIFGNNYMDCIPLALPDGQRDRQRDCWQGKAKFNAEDSPYRHAYEFFLAANDEGWMPPSMWTRLWEGDMEASYIAAKSVMMLHGPWVWDKALAAGSGFAVQGHQAGLPATPPAEGQAVWMQSALPPNIDNQWFIRAGNEKTPHWEQTQVAWKWFWSPEAIPMKAQAEGRWPLYDLDEALELKGPQFLQVLKHIGTEGGLWADARFEQGMTGNLAASPYRKKGSQGVWDWESNGNNEVFADLLQHKITVQQALDIAQRNWEESFDIPA